jgi:hypothetical protein
MALTEARSKTKRRVSYLYRDAGNYKFRGSFVVDGSFHLDQIEPFLFDSAYFVPERVGLPALRPKLINDDDHQLHEFESVEVYSGKQLGIPASEVLSRFKRAARSGWFIA